MVDQRREQIAGVIKKIALAITGGLDVENETAVLALAKEIEADLTPPTMVIRGWKAIENLVGKSRSQLWRDICAGHFPSPLDQYGENSVAWLRTEIEDWITSRPRRHYGARSQTLDVRDMATTRSPALPRRRGQPRKDAKRSTTDDSTDSVTIRNVMVKDNRVVRVHHWMHRMGECFGAIRKAA
jgi:predicted DNA-binding transcriptional regulator AlpA